jgi:hypothetical protein
MKCRVTWCRSLRVVTCGVLSCSFSLSGPARLRSLAIRPKRHEQSPFVTTDSSSGLIHVLRSLLYVHQFLSITCPGSLHHLHLEYALARTTFTKLYSSRALKGLRTFQSTNDDVEVDVSAPDVTVWPVHVPSLTDLSATVDPPNNNNNNNNTTTSTIDISNSPADVRPNTPPLQHSPATTLISPPPTPKHVNTAPLTRSSASDAAMNRAPLHGAPVRGQVPPSRGPPRAAPPPYGAQPAYGNQDARGNLAVQPAATTGSFKLKKAAVKMVGAAATTPDLIKSKPKEVKR